VLQLIHVGISQVAMIIHHPLREPRPMPILIIIHRKEDRIRAKFSPFSQDFFPRIPDFPPFSPDFFGESGGMAV
jgi:hypothetical protein